MITLTQYDQTNTRAHGLRGRRSIGVSRSGRVTISKVLSAEMGITTGCHVALLQDSNEPADWYLSNAGIEGFVVRDNPGAVFNCFGAVEAMLASVGFEGNSVSLVVGKSMKIGDRTVWPIVTKSATRKAA